MSRPQPFPPPVLLFFLDPQRHLISKYIPFPPLSFLTQGVLGPKHSIALVTFCNFESPFFFPFRRVPSFERRLFFALFSSPNSSQIRGSSQPLRRPVAYSVHAAIFLPLLLPTAEPMFRITPSTFFLLSSSVCRASSCLFPPSFPPFWNSRRLLNVADLLGSLPFRGVPVNYVVPNPFSFFVSRSACRELFLLTTRGLGGCPFPSLFPCVLSERPPLHGIFLLSLPFLYPISLRYSFFIIFLSLK